MSYTDKQGRKWDDMDVDSLSPRAKAAYDHYKDANRVASQHREAFEAIMIQDMNTDCVQFGYKFGKLSFTTDVEARKPKAKSKQAISLADWKARQAADGR